MYLLSSLPRVRPNFPRVSLLPQTPWAQCLRGAFTCLVGESWRTAAQVRYDLPEIRDSFYPNPSGSEGLPGGWYALRVRLLQGGNSLPTLLEEQAAFALYGIYGKICEHERYRIPIFRNKIGTFFTGEVSPHT